MGFRFRSILILGLTPQALCLRLLRRLFVSPHLVAQRHVGISSIVCADDLRLPKLLFQPYRIAIVLLFERGDQFWRMRYDQHLRAFRGVGDQSSQSRQQIRMQAGFRFIQNQQSRRSRRQQALRSRAGNEVCRQIARPLSTDAIVRAGASRSQNDLRYLIPKSTIRERRPQQPRPVPRDLRSPEIVCSAAAMSAPSLLSTGV